ncbi:MAG: peptide chain release factor N(5)-glutamine methyltransferase [Paludibacter sp.]|nr:peptide chain release factor N(5)-glutamine methyltransferase [Paludibacter sp.]
MKNLIQYIQAQLADKFSRNEIIVLNNMIIEKLTSLSYSNIFLNDNFQLTNEQIVDYQTIVERLKKDEPVQYILGYIYFYGLKFIVNQNVMIPRPETEELLEWILQKNSTGSILDIGTGSGCIAITLAEKNHNLKLWALDCSKEALEIAKKNAIINNVNITFLENDILQIPHFEQKWDIIVSNPPYIPQSERETMQKSVSEFEPNIALFVGDENPLIFYEKIIQFAKNQLNANGKIYFEIHKNFGNETKILLKKNGFKNIILKKDISGNDRMIYGEFDIKKD